MWDLDYADSLIDIRVPVNIQVGRSSNRGEANWVIWNAGPGSPNRKAIFVVEAKAPGQAITSEVQAQTRSYAFGLNAPVYLCTNAMTLQVFHRGVEMSASSIATSASCQTTGIASAWHCKTKPFSSCLKPF